VPGGGAALFHLEAGDGCRVLDPEGGQAVLVYAPDLTAIGLAGAGAPSLADLLAESPDGPPIAAALAEAGFAVDQLQGSLALDDRGNAGASWTGNAARSLPLVVVAPGAPMAPAAQNPPTAVIFERMPAQGADNRLPPPLAAVKADIRVPAGGARAYEVRRGEYIQIIDVAGRQCSDFVAFDAAALRAGVEHCIDPTSTRTLLGQASPCPGLHARYVDDRLLPLVEVVRDTVGRHDTFLLACTAKYYEDAGYPGHANCSDNFNAVLAPFGVTTRRGWAAINFFYNTRVEASGAITMDEPWSQPGDYVLLRALTDLLCASSACPDDIDPANGWEPTDIHVRVYDAAHQFSRGVAHRMTPASPPRLTRETGFHPRTAAATRHFVEYRGFWLPSRYTADGPIGEYWACRERVAIVDLSPLRKFEVLGPDAELLMQHALTRDVRKLAAGQVVYSAMCHEHGGMLDDCTLFRLGQANFRLVAGDDYAGEWLRSLVTAHGFDVRVKSSTDQLHNCAVQGPLSRDLLGALLETSPQQPTLTELGWFRFTIGRLAARPVLVSRTGYTGELGYEIWCHPSDAPAVWDAVMTAGAPLGIRPLGLDALDMLRIEAGLAFAGHEFCDQTDPFEAGIGFTVTASKTEDFVGSAALARRRASPQRCLVGLDINSGDTVGHGDPVHAGRAQVGVVTSATHSPILQRQIALARIDVACATHGNHLEIGKLDGQLKRIGAVVAPFPHYDPQKSRVRA